MTFDKHQWFLRNWWNVMKKIIIWQGYDPSSLLERLIQKFSPHICSSIVHSQNLKFKDPMLKNNKNIGHGWTNRQKDEQTDWWNGLMIHNSKNIKIISIIDIDFYYVPKNYFAVFMLNQNCQFSKICFIQIEYALIMCEILLKNQKFNSKSFFKLRYAKINCFPLLMKLFDVIKIEENLIDFYNANIYAYVL
jgi:hypothetical protein